MTEETFKQAIEIRRLIAITKGRLRKANHDEYFHTEETKYKGSMGNIAAAERATKKVNELTTKLDELRIIFKAL